MKRNLLVLTLVFAISISGLMIACGDHDEYRHKPLTQESGDFNAKNMDETMSCDSNNVVVEDCLDACTCCYYGQQEATENCVQYCDELLSAQYYYDHEPTKADYTRFKECIVGCVSLCGGREKDDTCLNECLIFLGL